MKIQPNFMLREIAGSAVVVPVEEAAEHFHGMFTLNETSAFLWRHLEEETTEGALLTALLSEYEVDEETARQDIAKFLDSLRQAHVLAE